MPEPYIAGGPFAAYEEANRLAALRSLHILDTGPEPAFDRIVRVAAKALDAPIAAVSFVDDKRQWFKAVVGLPLGDTPREMSICAHAILQSGQFVVPDATQDPRFASNPLVMGEAGLGFYAGALLSTDEGMPLGTLCVLDCKARPGGITEDQSEALAALADAVMLHLKLRRDNKALAESELHLRTVVDVIPQMVWSSGPGGKDDYRNRRWYEFTGASPGESSHSVWLAASHPQDRGRVEARWRQSLDTGEDYEAEYRMRHHSGAYRWILERAVPVRDERGLIERWFGTSTDIDDWKLAEAELREKTTILEATLENMDEGLVMMDADSRVTLFNSRALELLDLPRDLLASRPHTDEVKRYQVNRGDLLPGDRITLGGARGGFGSDPRNYERVRADGTVLEIRTNVLPNGGAVRTFADITARRRSEVELRASEERLRLAVEMTSLGIWDIDLESGRPQWTVEARQILGLPITATIDRDSFRDRVHPADRAEVEEKFFTGLPPTGETYSGSYRVLPADGSEERWVLASGRTLLNELGMPVRKIGTIQDITIRKKSEDALRASEERLRIALHAGRMFAWEQNLETDYITRSQNSIQLLGIGSGPLSEFLDNVHPDDQAWRETLGERIQQRGYDTAQFRYSMPDGRMLWFGSRAEVAGPNRVIGVTFDITDRKLAEEEIWRGANHDSLTGLPNRALFQLRFEQALDRARKRGTSVSLLLIDLDDFKDVNDTLGHDAGDALLKKVAERLSAMTRDCDTVARLGGDEFALLVVDPLTLDHATSLARIVAETVKQPFVYKGRTFSTRASIGVAAFPDHDSDPRDLLKDADIALYRAKAKGRNRVESYSAQLRTIVEQRLALGEEVRAAIAKDQFVPFYQPKICLSTNRIVGFEALARWQHPSKGVLTPEHFGAVFDDHELGAAIGRQLLLKVTADMRGWLDVAFDIGRVAINLSSAQFNDPGLADEILDVLERRRIAARSFEVEVTETVLLSKSADQVEVILKRFHDCGVQVALDDFGTGYASLTHLKRFPVDHIKIDQSFIMNLEKDAGDDAIVSAVVGLGTNLGMQITAEGVETQGQARRLRELGCHNAQGFLFSRPVGAPQVPHLLSRFSHKPSSRERSSAVRG